MANRNLASPKVGIEAAIKAGPRQEAMARIHMSSGMNEASSGIPSDSK
jgi:hypothetical protein